MPLSEDEHRILQEIEQELYRSDPGLAREVGSTTLYSHAFRNIKWALLGFAVGVVIMITTLSTSHWYAFVGFTIMLVSALVCEHYGRKLGRAGLQQVTDSMRTAGFRDYLGSSRSKMRDRLNREDED